MDEENTHNGVATNIAVVGATGTVGTAMLELLAQRGFARSTVYPLASDGSANETVMFGNKPLLVEALSDFDFSRVGIALFAVDAQVSATHVARAADAGCAVIDCSGHFLPDVDIPLVVYNVNPAELAGYSMGNVVAVPGAIATQLAAVLAPIHAEVGITRIHIATYQAVSGAGRGGVDVLAGQTAALLNGLPIAKQDVFPRQIAFNLIPSIGTLDDQGHASEELRVIRETQRLLGDTSIAISATCVQVPVFHGHAVAVHFETCYPIGESDLRKLLKKTEDVTVVDSRAKDGCPTPVTEAAGADGVFVGRLRTDLFNEKGINLWIVSDNLRNGAAMNSIRLAELLIKSYL